MRKKSSMSEARAHVASRNAKHFGSSWPGLGLRDHRDAPLRGGPVMTKETLASAVIYGEASDGKTRAINKLLIDDQRWHL
jgi:hypothetical protein